MKVYFILNLMIYIIYMININIFLYIFDQILNGLAPREIRCAFIYGRREYT